MGILKESTEARKVTREVIRLLRLAGNKVYDCTVDNGKSEADVLKKIVKKCNAHKVDLDVSIHFNSGAGDEKGDGRTTGTEVLVYSTSSASYPYAKRIVKQIAALGFTDRGVKVRKNLYFLNHTIAPALLVECAFVDDKDDAERYHYKKMAAAIAEGIIGGEICPYPVPVKSIRPGSSREDIRWLQCRLNLKIHAGLAVDGKYGPLTRQAVLDYWNSLGWNKKVKNDGYTAGKKTIRQLKK